MSASTKIVVFSTPTCPWCNRVKSFLKQKGYRFKEVDVSRDQKAAQDLQRRTGQMGVPVTLINNRPVVGFNQKKIEKLLEQSK
ncbi:MAG: glutaredoxin family protein [Spirochaetota bacterium]